MMHQRSRFFGPGSFVAFLCVSFMNANASHAEKETYAKCWNENLYKPGHSRSLKYQRIGLENPVTESISVSRGNDDTVVVSKETQGGVIPDSSPWKDIYKVDFDAKTTKLVNSKSSRSTWSYPPGIVTDYKLNRGDSITNEFRELNPDLGTNERAEITETFAGIETIDLPNISDVEACRVERTIRSGESSNTTSTTQTRWYAVGSGIFLRMRGPNKIRQEFAGDNIPLYD